MGFYKYNALCEYANEQSPEHFYFANNDVWILLYGNKADKAAKVLALVSEVDNDNDYNSTTFLEKERVAADMVKYLWEKSKDITCIAFRYMKGSFSECRSLRGAVLTLEELYEKFKNSGLEVASSKAGKDVNKYTSGDFHDWQRENMGSKIIVTDFDLIGLDDNGRPEVVYELKRSKRHIDKWVPYPDDFSNFEMLMGFCDRAKLDFLLVFNHYSQNGERQKDDLTALAAFYFKTTSTGVLQHIKIGKYTPDKLIDKTILEKYRSIVDDHISTN